MARRDDDWVKVTFMKHLYQFQDGSVQEVGASGDERPYFIVPASSCECPSIIFAYLRDETEHYNYVKMISHFELGLQVIVEIISLLCE